MWGTVRLMRLIAQYHPRLSTEMYGSAAMDADKLFDRTLMPIMLIGAVIGAVVGFYIGISGLGLIVGLALAVVGAFLGGFCGMFIAGILRSWT
jgi:hypothetical protein